MIKRDLRVGDYIERGGNCFEGGFNPKRRKENIFCDKTELWYNAEVVYRKIIADLRKLAKYSIKKQIL